MSSPASTSSGPKLVATHPRGLALVAFMVLAVVAAFTYLASSVYVVLAWALTPEPGAEAYVLILKALFPIGLAAIGWWLFLDFWRGRWRFVAAPVAAWAWVYVIAALLSGSAFLNVGY